jgi:O-acetyl-ADP-ribose deacetylase (regulator of RNase III)
VGGIMYQIVSENITKFKVPGKKTAIINSLGYHKSVTYPGQLFRSILNACDDRNALMDEVKSKGQSLDYCSVFETQSYGLPANGIIHAITPLRVSEDDSLFFLGQTYEHIFALLKKEKYESVLIPFLGTGANGYSNIEVFNKLTQVCAKLCDKYSDIDFNINIYYVERTIESIYEEEEELNNLSYQELINSHHKTQILFQSKTIGSRRYRPKNPIAVENLDLNENTSFSDLIDQYIEKNFPLQPKQTLSQLKKQKWNEIFSTLGTASVSLDQVEPLDYLKTIGDNQNQDATSRKKDLWRNNYSKPRPKIEQRDWMPPHKTELLLIAYALGMSKHDTYTLYKFCGYYLSDWNRLDKTIIGCINYVEYEGGLIFMIIYFYKELGISLYSEH